MKSSLALPNAEPNVLAHRGVAERGVLGVHVQIARVPAGPAHLRLGAWKRVFL
jgi:hypothetical protein